MLPHVLASPLLEEQFVMSPGKTPCGTHRKQTAIVSDANAANVASQETFGKVLNNVT